MSVVMVHGFDRFLMLQKTSLTVIAFIRLYDVKCGSKLRDSIMAFPHPPTQRSYQSPQVWLSQWPSKGARLTLPEYSIQLEKTGLHGLQNNSQERLNTIDDVSQLRQSPRCDYSSCRILQKIEVEVQLVLHTPYLLRYHSVYPATWKCDTNSGHPW